MRNKLVTKIFIDNIETTITDNISKGFWTAHNKFDKYKIPISNYKPYNFEVGKNYYVLYLFNKFIKLYQIVLISIIIFLFLFYAIIPNPLIGSLALILGFLFFISEIVFYNRTMNDAKTIETTGIVDKIIIEKRDDSDSYFNYFSIKYELNETILFQKALNAYTFVDIKFKKIIIKPGDKIKIKYDSNIPEYIWWVNKN